MANGGDRGIVHVDERLNFRGPAEVPVVRDFVAVQAAVAGLPAERLDDLRLAVTELASNCVRHGDGGGSVWVRVGEHDDEFVCEVASRGGSIDLLSGITRPPPGASRGWGLYLVSEVSDETEIASGGGVNVVRIKTNLN